ncbi:hypothetical protein GCM10010358_74110 [Streptomyces minutiscleroticus]|uniref:Uncharacterized protein n=1 Tax=Streptomyces minutiscleroticus TaxID=68238 RepID=A0A918P0K2_9ACTN|nr:hypothetical protein GCM10010358_74110 [Streptomyces minutiscleroticus]
MPSAALTGVMAAVPRASAAVPGNCPWGDFRVWSVRGCPTPEEAPALATDGKWSGRVPGATFDDHTGRAGHLEYGVTADGRTYEYSGCVRGSDGQLLNSFVSVTKPSRHEGDGPRDWDPRRTFPPGRAGRTTGRTAASARSGGPVRSPAVRRLPADRPVATCHRARG